MGEDKKDFLRKRVGLKWLSFNLRWTLKPPHRQTDNAKKGAPTKLYKHALVYPFVIFFPPLTHSFSHSLSLLDALGLVSPGEMCHPLSDIPVASGQPTSAPLTALFPNGSGLVFPEVPLSREHLSTIISWLTQLISLTSGNPELSLPTLSTVMCFTVDLFWSIPLPVRHFVSSIDTAFDFCPCSNQSNLIFTQHFYSI